MQYETIQKGIFQSRPNRFVAYVTIDGKEEKVHVKNTGRCKELLLPKTTVFLEKSKNTNRKTKYSLVAVYKGNNLINMDSQAPNIVVKEALHLGKITEIGIPSFVKREVKFGNSRFDIYYEKEQKRGFIEVKGVTLEENAVALFPDAPTQRGTKHIYELIQAKKEGYEANILFLIQMQGVDSMRPHWKRDVDFANALQQAQKQGVAILAYDCIVKEDSICLAKKVPFFIK